MNSLIILFTILFTVVAETTSDVILVEDLKSSGSLSESLSAAGQWAYTRSRVWGLSLTTYGIIAYNQYLEFIKYMN